MQTICTSLQTDNHTNTSSLNFYRPDVRALKELVQWLLLQAKLSQSSSVLWGACHNFWPSLWSCITGMVICGLCARLQSQRGGALTLLVGWQEGHPACKKLMQDADLHMAQLMPLPLTVSCFSKIQIGFTSLVPAHPGSPRQRAIKWVCVCKKQQ